MRNTPLLLLFATLAVLPCRLVQAQSTDSTRHARRVLTIDKAISHTATQAAAQGARIATDHHSSTYMPTPDEAERHHAVPMRHMRMEHGPYFPGGDDSLAAYMHRHLRYPEEARSQQIQGEVYISFTVDTLGAIDNVRCTQDIGGGCREEAVRVVTQMPYWVPARNIAGHRVRVETVIPIMFSLENTIPPDASQDIQNTDEEHSIGVDPQNH